MAFAFETPDDHHIHAIRGDENQFALLTDAEIAETSGGNPALAIGIAIGVGVYVYIKYVMPRMTDK